MPQQPIFKLSLLLLTRSKVVMGGMLLYGLLHGSLIHAQPLLIGMESIETTLPYAPDTGDSGLLLSRYAYSSLEVHLDGILWHDNEPPVGPDDKITVRFRDHHSGILREESMALTKLPGFPLFFSATFPSLEEDFHGNFEIELNHAGKTRSHSREISIYHEFIEDPVSVIQIEVPNPDNLSFARLPISVGIPMPLGLLWDLNQLSLVDQTGKTLPFQAVKRSLWNRRGSIKWIQLSFVAPVQGMGQSFSLLVTNQVGKQDLVADPLSPETSPSGWWLERMEQMDYLGRNALSGGYVIHAAGRLYKMNEAEDWSIDESGDERIVLKRDGWFLNNGDLFCKYVSRLVLFKNSPVVRLFHTWIYTGHPEEDKISEMGWKLSLNELEPQNICFNVSGSEGDTLLETSYVQQINPNGYFDSTSETRRVEKGRITGTGCLQFETTSLGLGIKDFWQNFPREIEYRDNAVYFREWPRLGHAEADRKIQPGNALRLWFAHEGEKLDLSVPEAYFTDDSLLPASAREGYRMGRGKFAHTVNAQGIAKTMEILFFSDEKASPEEVIELASGLLDGQLKAVVDPSWIASSGVFYEIHPRDLKRFERHETIYDLHARAPMRWIERMNLYGKWIWGDMTWAPDLPGGNPGLLYRGFRKAHQGWPYPWLPFVRSGSTDLRNMADAATRHMADVPYIHYADERAVIANIVQGKVVNQPRERGRMIRYHIPWGSHQYWRGPEVRGYTDKVDYLWHAYYLNDYWRARDVVLDWAELTKNREKHADPVFNYNQIVNYSHYPRNTVTLLQSYVQMYEETFDPWFLAAAYQIACNVHLRHFRDQGVGENSLRPEMWFWQPGLREFQRFSQSFEYLKFYLTYADRQTDSGVTASDWGRNVPMLEAPAYAYWLTGEEKFLQRINGWLESTADMTYTGEPDYWKGARVGAEVFTGPVFTPYYLSTFPYALAALAHSGSTLDFEPNAFFQLPDQFIRQFKDNKISWHWEMPLILIRKDTDDPITLRFQVGNPMGRHPQDSHYTVGITDPLGNMIERIENLPANNEYLVELAGDHTAGVYSIHVSGNTPEEPRIAGYGNRSAPSLRLPLSSIGTPEVIIINPGQKIGPAHYYPQYWTDSSLLADDTSASIVLQNIALDDGSPLIKATLRTVDGNILWKEQFDRNQQGNIDTLTVPYSTLRSTIEGDKLTGLILPFYYKSLDFGNSKSISLAVSPSRWFNPESK